MNSSDCKLGVTNIKRKRPVEDADESSGFRPRVVYVIDMKLLFETTKIPHIKNRNFVVDHLIESYKLKQFMEICEATPATEDDLRWFHASNYIEHLKIERNIDDDDDDNYTDENDSEFGLGYDCPLLKDTFGFVCSIAGGTLTAADKLINRTADIAINWAGGWHHAQRDGAEGFCYINDIVLGIQHLLKVFNYVLYIDLDVHHGNGVENAFAFTRKVLTLSFHEFEPGFYPCSGSVNDIGLGKGKYFTVNVPLREGISDSLYCAVFNRVACAVESIYKPDAVIVQCGSDGLAHDPIGEFNLTHEGYGQCVRTILKWKKPTLFLGGGYNIANTARCWTYLTSIILDEEISSDIPDDFNYFRLFGPDYELRVTPSNRKDMNTSEYIDNIVTTIMCNVKNITENSMS
ncbi:histone deacetylase 8-like isoform X2 [Lycorma delicatula]|uniref:histone deacetylase 8-like isoform X2 n=1 Tax=Lycorma delicatula TaxID=130591 RepID=UPI003F516797